MRVGAITIFICLFISLISCKKDPALIDSDSSRLPQLSFEKAQFLEGTWHDSLVSKFEFDQLPSVVLKKSVQPLLSPEKSRLQWEFLRSGFPKKRAFIQGKGRLVSGKISELRIGKPVKVPRLNPEKSTLISLFHLKGKHGLPGTAVHSLCEDKAGRIWIGTDNGLALYDGNYLHNFRMEDGLPNLFISCITRLSDGRMAIGTKSGFMLTDGIKLQLIDLSSGLLSNFVTALEETNGKLFIGTERGLQIFEQGKLFTPDLPAGKITGISADHKSWISFCFEGGEMFQLNLNTRQLTEISLPFQTGCNGLKELNSGELLFFIPEKGILKWKDDSLFIGHSAQLDFSTMDISLFAGDKRKIWFSGFNAGLFSLNDQGEVFSILPDEGLIGIQHLSLIKATDGSILLGSAGGLNVLKDTESRQFLLGENMNGLIPFGLAVGPDSALFISTVDGGVNRWHQGQNQSYKANSGLHAGTAFNFAFDKAGRTFIATSGGGLDFIEGNSIRNIGFEQGLSSLDVNAVLVSSDSSLYIGTNKSGLFRWRKGKLFHVQSKADIPGQSIFSLFEASDSSIIIGTNPDGIFSLRNGKFKKIILPSGKSIPPVYPIREWNGQICFGTFGAGLFLWKGDSIARIGEKEGLANESVLSQIPLSKNLLLCGTGKGISLINVKDNHLRVKNINADNALQFEDCNPYSVAFDGQNVWLGAGNSLLRFSGSQWNKPAAIRSRIQLVRFGGKEALRLSSSGILQASEEFSEPLKIPFDLNTAFFQTGHQGFLFPQEQVEYAWQLYPLDKNWKIASEVSEPEYPRLDAGEYTFRFRVREAGMEWSRVQEINFTILPPWWQKWSFYLTELAFGMLIIAGIVQFRTRNLRKQKEKLEETVKVRTAEVVRQKEMVELERHKSEELLLNILPENVAEELKNTGRYEARHFDEVTIMFTDFKDFTRISETMSPTELVEEIDEYFRAFDSIVQKHGVEKIKTIGDSYMAAGGIPVSDPDHAIKMVAAALEIRDQVDKIRKERESNGRPGFQARIGIHTGPVVAGIVGSRKFAYDIWGDSVNLASRLESSGEAGKINISIATYQKIKDSFICIPRGKITTKSKGDVEMYFVEEKKESNENTA